MKYVINIVLIALVALMAYLLYNSIQEPIVFEEAHTKRKNAVVEKLKKIRTAQELHRDMKGEFAKTFDSLKYVLTNDSIAFVKLEEDPSDPGNPDKFIRTVTYSPAIDSVRSLKLGSLDSLAFVPYTGGKVKFDMTADTLTYQQTLVPVMEVATKYEKFMGKFANEKYKRYSKSYDPKATLKIGNMNKPSLSGNW